MMQFYYIVFLVSVIWLFISKEKFIIWLPLFYVILDSSFSYFTTLSIVTYLRPAVFLILMLFYLKRIRINPLSKYLFLWFVYTLILVLVSPKIFYSFKGYAQVFISMMTFVLGLIYFDNINKLHALNKIVLAVLVFSVIATSAGYIFGIGRYFDYERGTDREAIGLLGSSGLYSAAISIGILPLLSMTFTKKIEKWILYGFALVAYIFILLNIRRTAILIPVIGFLTYFWFIPNKVKAGSYLLLGLIILLVVSPFYSDILVERFRVRQEAGRFAPDFYKTESRYTENVKVFSDVLSFRNPVRSLFGYEIYASGREDIAENRMYHTDSANLLAGTGIIGVILYIIFYVKLFRVSKYFRRSEVPHITLLRSSYYSLLFISLFASLNGSMTLVSLRSLLFLYLGAILSLVLNSGIYQQETRKYNS